MSPSFVDTSFWIPCVNPNDRNHRTFRLVLRQNRSQLITSELVLFELLNYFSGRGDHLRASAAIFVEQLFDMPNLDIISLSTSQFRDAFKLYKSRSDKGWSLTDCASMAFMHELHIDTVFTLDSHFLQAGFKVSPEFGQC